MSDSKLAEGIAEELKRLVRQVSDASYTQGADERYDSEIKDRRNDEKVQELLSKSRAAIDRLIGIMAEQQAGEAVAWLRMFHGEVAMTYSTESAARGELERLNREYPEDAAHRYVIPVYTRPLQPLSDEQIEKGREAIFSTSNPFCPCDSKTMRKAVRWAERAHGITRDTK